MLTGFICILATAGAVIGGIYVKDAFKETRERAKNPRTSQEQSQPAQPEVGEPTAEHNHQHDAACESCGHHHAPGHQHAPAFQCYCGDYQQSPLGAWYVLSQSFLVVKGTVDSVDDAGTYSLRDVEALKGDLAGNSVEVAGLEYATGGHSVTPGTALILALNPSQSGAQWQPASKGMSVVDPADNDWAGGEALYRALVAPDANDASRAAALAQGVASGGPVTRFGAGFDLAHYRMLNDKLTSDQVSDLVTTLLSLDGTDPANHQLLSALASSQFGAQHASEIASILRGPRADKLFEALGYAFRSPILREQSANALLPLLATTESPTTRRLAAFVLARSAQEGSEAATSSLVAFVADQQQDVASEALIGLAGSTEHLSRARDILRLGMGTTPAADDEVASALDRELEARKLLNDRHSLNTGETLAMMAAGFYVARCGDQQEVDWLRKRLLLIKDASVRAFLTHALDNQWAEFDTAW